MDESEDRHKATIQGVTTTARAVAMALAYRVIAERLLRELVDQTPRSIDLFAIRDELLADAKNAVVEGTSIEEDATMLRIGCDAINEFFGAIKINPGTDNRD